MQALLEVRCIEAEVLEIAMDIVSGGGLPLEVVELRVGSIVVILVVLPVDLLDGALGCACNEGWSAVPG